MPKPRYSIGRLAAAGGCTVQTVRYYEKVGLLHAPGRTAGNHRSYDRGHMDRLVFIRHARKLGFALESIRELLSLADEPARSCASVDRIAREHLQTVDTQIARLQALRGELTRLIDQCRGGQIHTCRIIDALTAPSSGERRAEGCAAGS